MTLETLTIFFGWLTVINIGILALAALSILGMRNQMAAIHSALAGIDEADAKRSYFNWLGSYKLVTLAFCLAPYVALRIIA